jgi:hypothetical protein
MKPSLLIAAGCSWVAGRAIDTNPVAPTFDFDHVEDSVFVEQHSFAGIVQRRLGLDKIHFVARHGSNNDEQFSNVITFINNNHDQYSEIFVLWGLTSIYRWQMYSHATGQTESCMVGKKFKVDELSKEVKYYFSHHWDKETELKKLGTHIIALNGYLKNMGINHLFFNAFQSYNNSDLNISVVPEFYHSTENNNDMLSFLCTKNNIPFTNSSVPWLNLLKPANKQYNNQAVKKLQSAGMLDRATAHPTVQAHELIANELYDYIKEKNNERI